MSDENTNPTASDPQPQAAPVRDGRRFPVITDRVRCEFCEGTGNPSRDGVVTGRNPSDASYTIDVGGFEVSGAIQVAPEEIGSVSVPHFFLKP